MRTTAAARADASAGRAGPVEQPFSETLSGALHTEPTMLLDELQTV
jgi:hypothetical protein